MFSEAKGNTASTNGEEATVKEKKVDGENPNDDGAISDSDDEKEKKMCNFFRPSCVTLRILNAIQCNSPTKP